MAVRKPEQLTALVEKINSFASTHQLESDTYLNGIR
jgi:hypothetical protein